MVRYAQVGASDMVKVLHALGEEAFVREAGRKASIWWNQKGSEAARMKEKWLDDNKKRPASAPSDEPAPKHHAAALASAPRGLCRGWGLSFAPLSAPSTAPANCTRQSCCSSPHPHVRRERAAARSHATTTMHVPTPLPAHAARWNPPIELRLMEQLRALGAFKITS